MDNILEFNERISIIDKETQFFRNAVNLNQASSYRKFGAHVYVVKLNQLPNEQFDLVISNPPYISKNEMKTIMTDVKNFEPDIEGGYRRINGFRKHVNHIVPQTSSSSERVLMVAFFANKIMGAHFGFRVT